jgi:hypothetical protein
MGSRDLPWSSGCHDRQAPHYYEPYFGYAFISFIMSRASHLKLINDIILFH